MSLFRWLTAVALAMVAATVAVPTLAADACKSRGELDVMYCDANDDMVADAPTDPKKWKNPSTIVFTYTPAALRPTAELIAHLQRDLKVLKEWLA